MSPAERMTKALEELQAREVKKCLDELQRLNALEPTTRLLMWLETPQKAKEKYNASF